MTKIEPDDFWMKDITQKEYEQDLGDAQIKGFIVGTIIWIVLGAFFFSYIVH